MKRVLPERPDLSGGTATQTPIAYRPATVPHAATTTPAASPTPPSGHTQTRSASEAPSLAPVPPVNVEQYFLAGVRSVRFEVKDPEGPLYEVEWEPPEGDGADLDAIKGGVLAHIPGAKFKDFFTGRGRGGLNNVRDADAPYVMLSKGRDGIIAKFTSPQIEGGKVATMYEGDGKPRFAEQLQAAGIVLREGDSAALERLAKGEQKEAAIYGYPLRIRYGESSSGSLIVEGIVPGQASAGPG